MSLPNRPEAKRYSNVHNFAVLFSGGLDSTAVPLLIAPHSTGDIHLLTYFHHYGTFFNHWSKKHIPELKRELGDARVTHELLDIHNLYDEIAISKAIEDLKKHKSSFNFCLGCHQAMAARTIIYCLEHNITNVYICSSVGGEYAEMSLPVTRIKNTAYYERYGIRYDAPLLRLNMAKPEERALLKHHNISPGVGFRRSVQGYQPMCVIGLTHFMDVLFDIRPKYPSKAVGAFIDDKFPIMDAMIEAYFKAKGMDVDALTQANITQYNIEEKALAQWDAENGPAL